MFFWSDVRVIRRKEVHDGCNNEEVVVWAAEGLFFCLTTYQWDGFVAQTDIGEDAVVAAGTFLEEGEGEDFLEAWFDFKDLF